MEPQSPVQNFDAAHYLFWYERLEKHPIEVVSHLAEVFRDTVSEDLVLHRPYPRIVWYRPADYRVAASVWREAEVADRQDSPSSNPFTPSCRYFRFRKQRLDPNIDILHEGYTHGDDPSRIGICVDPREHTLLEMIAHECVHVLQDQREAGWRMNNIRVAEQQAEKYTGRVKDRFPQFFESYEQIIGQHAKSQREL